MSDKPSYLATQDDLIIELSTTSAYDITSSATQSEANHTDLQLANMAVQAIAQSWKYVKNFKELDTLTNLTFSALEKRRALLSLNYGTKVEAPKLPKNTFLD